ncbi:hypothetical protein ACFUCO_17005 [Heyndrickxia sporothermodurans]|uniref:hypothetical protein n=1 Tax=Heyndrickxia sporothermodurans TaxID=46224 RepID=UPI0036415691
MAKTSSPSFVLSLELKKNPLLFSVAFDELEICRVIYNTVLGKYLKLEKQMKREKRYKKLIRQLKAVSKKLEKNEQNKALIKDKKHIQDELKTLREKYHLTEYSSHVWVKPVREHFGSKVNSAVAQKIATRAWNTFSRKLFGKAKKVRFIQKHEMDSFEGKTNKTGWRYIDGNIVYKDLQSPLIVRKKDQYALEIIRHLKMKTEFSYKVTSEGDTKTVQDFYHVKYVRIVKKEIRGKVRLFADLVIAGYPPSKNRKLGKGKVGLDIGISTVAVSALTKVSLVNLAEQVKEISREITLTQRKMDRSKRTTNPQNFHFDGTIKKGKKYWVFSPRYKKLRAKLKEFHRKQVVIRTVSHRTLANRLLELGDTFYIETMNFKALQKRKKETEVSVKTGKYKRKKRFGKSLGHRAPAMFVSILEEKVKRLGGSFIKVNTHKFKASQYCHVRDNYIKKALSQCWHQIDENTKIQRDLYSAFLLMNSNASGTKANRKRCHETFPIFQNQHDFAIKEIISQKKMIFNSGIILNN